MSNARAQITPWDADPVTTQLDHGWRAGVAYYRISSDPQHDELGVRRQRKAVRKKAADERIHIVAEYLDDDVSAFGKKKRPGYAAFLAHAVRVDVAMAWHPDRLTRGDGRAIEDLVDSLGGDDGTPILTVQSGPYDLATPSGRMIARMVGAAARYESEHKSERVKLKMAEMAHDGKWSGGRRPYGYEADGVTICEPERDIIIECVARVLRGETMRSVAADLNARGVRTAGGKQWPSNSLKLVLTSPRLYGKRTHKGEIIGDAEWPGIISEAEHRKLVAVLATRSPVGRTGRKQWLLTGLLRCAKCETNLLAHTDNGARRYACKPQPGHPACGGVTVSAAPLTDFLLDACQKRIADLAAGAAAVGDPNDERDAADLVELARLDAWEAENVEDRASGAMSREAYNAASKRIAADRRVIETARAARVRSSMSLDVEMAREWAAGKSLALLLAEGDEVELRVRLEAVVEYVIVGPTLVRGRKTFDPERVQRIKWHA